MNKGDKIKTKNKHIFSYCHASNNEEHITIEIGTELIVKEISPNNPEFITVSRIGMNDNFGVRKSEI